MQALFTIKKIAVLGAGVMGAQIAAHCVNAGIETLLYDLSSNAGKNNEVVDKALANLTRLKPPPLATPDTLSLIQPKNYDDNLPELMGCDLIIEAIGERIDWKEALYQKIAPVINPKAILVSNTSGLSINRLCEMLPETLHTRFCGVHFFNPPRYMHLAELIPAKGTSLALMDYLETWLTRFLGKGVVLAKDTPNFIANRIGVFSLLITLEHAQTMQLSLDEVDALTGSLIGRPKSATFRTMDVVGLDTMYHVVTTMQEQLIEDPWHDLFKLPAWLKKLIQDGHLGQKTGQGIYRKKGNVIEVFDYLTGSYQLLTATITQEVKAIMAMKDLKERMQALISSTDKQAKFLLLCYRDLFHYACYHLISIANSVKDIDLALRWGFGWQAGPFELWQAFGIDQMRVLIEENNTRDKNWPPLPNWIKSCTTFYTGEGAFSPVTHSFLPISHLPVYQRQYFPSPMPGEVKGKLETLFENEGLYLRRFKDDIGLVSFKTKSNTINSAVVEGLQQAIEIAERDCRALILYQDHLDNFSSGADLRYVIQLVQARQLTAVEDMIMHFQQAVMKLKYCAIPTLAALRGHALGGGCEILMHCHRIIAAFESYPGLTEAGLGLIPTGGGCKEIALRAAAAAGETDVMTLIQPFFEQIATGVVASSAPDALRLGFFRPSDTWVMHREEVLCAALAEAEALLAQNHRAPLPRRFKVAGREGQVKLQTELVKRLPGELSEHDIYFAQRLASVLCGGDVNQGTLVDEQFLLNFERKVFMELLETPSTQARIKHFLETGRFLRN